MFLSTHRTSVAIDTGELTVLHCRFLSGVFVRSDTFALLFELFHSSQLFRCDATTHLSCFSPLFLHSSSLFSARQDRRDDGTIFERSQCWACSRTPVILRRFVRSTRSVECEASGQGSLRTRIVRQVPRSYRQDGPASHRSNLDRQPVCR